MSLGEMLSYAQESPFAVRPVTLGGTHARLEPLEERHLADLARIGGEREIWRYMGFGSLEGEEALRAWLAGAVWNPEESPDVAFAIVDLASGRAAGSTSLFDISEQHRHLEIGRTWLGAPYRRTPINTECKYLLLRHAFEELGAFRVQLKTDGRNERSQRAIERIGAKKEGVLRSHMRLPDGYVRDSVIYSVIAREWPETKAHLERLMERSPR